MDFTKEDFEQLMKEIDKWGEKLNGMIVASALPEDKYPFMQAVRMVMLKKVVDHYLSNMKSKGKEGKEAVKIAEDIWKYMEQHGALGFKGMTEQEAREARGY